MTILDHREPSPTPGAARSRSWLLFRAIATCVAVLILGQAALAGGFLSGHYGALAAHGANVRPSEAVEIVVRFTDYAGTFKWP